MKNRIASVVSIILMICMISITAYAIEVPDLGKKGSVSVKMSYNGEAVAGGELTAYAVAEVKVENGADYSFAYTESFAECEADISDITKAEPAEELAAYAADKSLSGVTLEIGENGNVKFEELTLGLYLFVQEKAAEGYSAVKPFIVSVPAYDNGSYVYDVDATPKVGTMPEPVETTAPETEPETTIPDAPPKLPQTGMNKWPVPVLFVFGAAMIVVGVCLVSSKKKRNEN